MLKSSKWLNKNKIVLASLLTILGPQLVQAQSAVIRGESAPGVYENLKSVGQGLSVSLDSNKASYMAGTSGFVPPAAGLNDIFCIRPTGSTKMLRIGGLYVTLFTTGANDVVDLLLVKRSTANTGGTAATLTNVPVNSSFAAATALVQSYTASPTAGTLVGILDGRRVAIFSNNLSQQIYQFPLFGGSFITLNSATEQLCVNLNGKVYAGITAGITVYWSEVSP